MQEFDKKNKNIEAVEEPDKTSEATNAEASGLGGVSKEILDKGISSHTSSEDQLKAQADADASRGNLINVASKDNIVSEDTWGAINQQFKTPSAVTQADEYLKSQLGKIQSGKTSYSDQVRGMMSQIQNRDKFSYDVDSDPLFQQALASAMNSGKSAMQDTMGQAAALTGGYGSTYATSAANQAYNSFIEDAYNNLPQYYQMAMEAYQMEGDEMYRQLDMFNAADATEYDRMLNAYDATSQYRNQMYNEAYQQHRDGISDAFASANLQINEHGQLVSDAAMVYNANSEYADTLYEREYTKWADEVSQAMKYAEMLNSEYWNQKNFDEGVRQYDQSFAEEQRQFDTTFAEEQRQFNETLAEDQRQFDADNKYKYDALAQDQAQFNTSLSEEQRQFNTTHGDTNGDGVLSADEIAAYNAPSGGSGGGLSLSKTELSAARTAFDNAGGGEAGYAAAVAELKAMGITIDETNEKVLMDALNGGTVSEGDVTTTTSNKTGTVKNFNTTKGDNFDITIDGTDYRVENEGKVTDEDTRKALEKISVKDGEAFLYDGSAYVKYAGGYFKVGSTEIFGFSRGGENDVINALRK